MSADYEAVTDVEIFCDGEQVRGRYRVMNGSVIVYYKDGLKFADHGMTPAALVAQWLLKALARRDSKQRRKAGFPQTA
ncbi:hypothetical protein [Caballeronia arationis]|jgi:hypothetical protein|uniref:hypothetical protein n=1 Tax=Caballeronia arationis TaxID=1777142 RepID=UPI000A7189DB|nr:hypothetical protein [Caballeronia arationis]